MLGILLLAALCGNGSVSAPVRYVVTDLGVLFDHQSSRAFSINNSGVVVGESTQGFLTHHAFVWKSGVLNQIEIDLPQNKGRFVTSCEALAVSHLGLVAGTYMNESGACRGWFFRDGKTCDLGTLGGNFCAPYAMNSAGMVVGCTHNADYKNHAFMWKDGVMIDLFPHAEFSVATDVNESGDVVGFFQDERFQSVAFLRRASGEITYLGASSAEGSRDAQLSALGINDRGHVVGLSWPVNGHRHAFLFDGECIRDLGTLRRDDGTFDTTSEAFEINNSDVVIGESVSLGALSRPFVWTRERGMEDLQKLCVAKSGFCLERVTDINDKGDIIGFGHFSNGPTHAVLLTPSRAVSPQTPHSLSTNSVRE